jgi:hypothetical protein
LQRLCQRAIGHQIGAEDAAGEERDAGGDFSRGLRPVLELAIIAPAPVDPSRRRPGR